MIVTFTEKFNDFHRFKQGYTNHPCTHCGASNVRTVFRTAKHECGATDINVYLCKVCIIRDTINDTRPHYHVGFQTRVIRTAEKFSFNDFWVRSEMKKMAFSQTEANVNFVFESKESKVVIPESEFAIRTCNIVQECEHGYAFDCKACNPDQ